MTKEEFTNLTWEKFQAWSESQKEQTSGYEYEKSFDKMIVEMGQDILEKEVDDTKISVRKKKDKDTLWKGDNTTDTSTGNKHR